MSSWFYSITKRCNLFQQNWYTLSFESNHMTCCHNAQKSSLPAAHCGNVYLYLFIFRKKMRLGSILIGMGQNNMENDAMEYPQCGVTIDCNAFHVYYVYFT